LLSLSIPPPQPPPAVAASARPASEERQRESESHTETSPPGAAPPAAVVPPPAVVGRIRLLEEEWQQEPMCDIEPPPPGATPPPAVELRPLSPLETPPVVHVTPDRHLAPPTSEHPPPPPQVTPPVAPVAPTDQPSSLPPPDPTPPAANDYCWSPPVSTPPPPGFVPATPDYWPTSPRHRGPSVQEDTAVTDSPDHRPPRRRSPRTADAAVQCSGDPDRRSRVRRAILRGREVSVYLRPISSHLGRRSHAEDRPRDVDLTVDPARQRRVCDCRTCVPHALRLAAGSWSAEVPAAHGIRFSALPGLALRTSSTRDRESLSRRLLRSPEKTLVVCGCPTCVVHRNFLRAWTDARALAAPEAVPPEAGGCRGQPRDQRGIC